MGVEKIYIPCLRWKQGEYQALLNLSPKTKDSILPLIDVAEFFTDAPDNSYDFEESTPPKNIDEHLSKFAERVRIKWGTDQCFVDLRLVDPICRLADGQHPVSYIFTGLRSLGVDAIPVAGLEQDAQYRASIYKTIREDKKGLCLRIGLQKATGEHVVENVDRLLGEAGLGPDQCDLIFDLGAPDNFEPLDVFVRIIESIIRSLPYINSWRSFSLIGTSMPVSVNKLPGGISILQRNEWILYKQLITSLRKSGTRVPIFGDYVINHPAALNLNMRYIYPKAAIRYTIPDRWLISRGEPIRGRTGVGLGQFRNLCTLIVESKYYCGPSFSFGDGYILKCANQEVKPGNLPRFREVGTSHHLEMMVRDLSNLDAS